MGALFALVLVLAAVVVATTPPVQGSVDKIEQSASGWNVTIRFSASETKVFSYAGALPSYVTEGRAVFFTCHGTRIDTFAPYLVPYVWSAR